MRVFELASIMETDNKGKVTGSFKCPEQMKEELNFDKSSKERRPCKYHMGKVFIGDGNSIIQYNLAKLKSDTTFSFNHPISAIDAKDQDVHVLNY